MTPNDLNICMVDNTPTHRPRSSTVGAYRYRTRKKETRHLMRLHQKELRESIALSGEGWKPRARPCSDVGDDLHKAAREWVLDAFRHGPIIQVDRGKPCPLVPPHLLARPPARQLAPAPKACMPALLESTFSDRVQADYFHDLSQCLQPKRHIRVG